ncbi:esterase family protein [Rhodococcus triatomae]|uniref:S-formylglutathione hydrolase FrmB n=1 Tax=Rhodococcus triatomae TaxID=300028 RepID=A0A1G8GXS5_9NOCA|nr:alpha/beta hydrolase family protein [Rhodococcus triatomae]QNG20266.1 esterase family protein [Rhodococcus triatomae]QNG23819.1 esterase family protein [Rhodococcus triatomae]SDH99198.1 S-formylglutathione hydrolase FrmB [Rhodococcus triatomae]
MNPARRRPALVWLLTAVLTAAAWLVPLTDPPAADARVTRIDVFSPSMNRWIANDVITPATGAPTPTFYLLTGIGGGEDGISWFNNSHVRDFFAGENVTVVLPVGGAFSMYTDWIADDPVLGRNSWQTYLTRELPAAVEQRFPSTGLRAIGGVSMSGGPALDLAIQAPGFYRAAASYSGCPMTSGPLGEAIVRSMVEVGGRGNAANMWGPFGAPLWTVHDPMANAARLHGVEVFVSAASGWPGPIDNHDPGFVVPQTIGGAAVEALAAACTGLFELRLRSLGVPATFRYYPEGSHSWGLFEAELRDSWPLIARAIGA